MTNNNILSDDPQTGKEIRAFFDEFIQTYPKDNLRRYLNLFQHDENLVMFSTGENWIGWKSYKNAHAEELKRLDKISFSYDWLKVNSYGEIAWVAAKVTLIVHDNGKQTKAPARLTCVLKKIDNSWKIVQGHISVPN